MTLLITLIFLTDVSFIIPNEYPFRPCGKIVLVAIQDEGSNHVKSALDALKILGATEPVLPDCRGRRESSSTAWSRNSLYFLLVFPSSRRWGSFSRCCKTSCFIQAASKSHSSAFPPGDWNH